LLRGKLSMDNVIREANTMTTATDLLQSVKIRVGLLADSRVTGFDVEVEVDNGVARLTGTVETEEQRLAVEEVAAAVEGVVEIENEIVIAPGQSTEDRMEAASDERLTGAPGMVGQALAPAAYGGPAPGVYTVTSPDSLSEVSDDELLNRVRDAIILEDRIDSENVSAHVDNGVVYLHGKVSSFDELNLAEGAVSSVPGVQHIRNDIEVEEAGCRQCNEW
jgi:osmotically-inducible protein OsmY